MRMATSISRLITYMNEQDEGNHLGFFGIVADDDDTTDDDATRVYDEVPSLNVIAFGFTDAARAKIEKSGGKCLSFHQLPPTFQKKFISDFAKHHDTMFIFKPNINDIRSCSSNQTMTNVRRRIQGGENYYCVPTMTRAFMDDLNDDLFFEILIRLSAKTLGGLKVINKRWYSLISNPSFVANHTSLQTPRDASSFLSETSILYSNEFGDNITLFSFNRRSPDLLNETTFTLDLSPVENSLLTICASCRGLLMVLIGSYIYIYNPLTKKKKHIPEANQMLHCNYGIIVGGSTSSGQYDCNNHYTLVCLLEASKAFKFMIFWPKLSRWRYSNKSSMISYGINELKIGSVCAHILPVCYRGIIHWLTQEGCIIAFNLDKEESRVIEIPKSVTAVGLTTDWWNCTWLGVLEDEVILVVATSKQEIVTWVLYDYENNKWKIKRKDVIDSGTIPVVYIRPLFFDGQRFLLTITTDIYYKFGCTVCVRMEHDVRTGVSKPLRSEGGSSFVGSLVCVPIINTLTEV